MFSLKLFFYSPWVNKSFFGKLIVEISMNFDQWRTEGGFGVFKPPPPKFRRYRWSPRSHEQEESASRFPFAVHCVLIRL